jgi:hypothetical protein
MTKYKFLSIVDKLNKGDFATADFLALKLKDGSLSVSSKDQGNFFLVYLVKDYGKGIEIIGVVDSYDEAKDLVGKLTEWLSEDDWDKTINDDGWQW